MQCLTAVLQQFLMDRERLLSLKNETRSARPRHSIISFPFDCKQRLYKRKENCLQLNCLERSNMRILVKWHDAYSLVSFKYIFVYIRPKKQIQCEVSVSTP